MGVLFITPEVKEVIATIVAHARQPANRADLLLWPARPEQVVP